MPGLFGWSLASILKRQAFIELRNFSQRILRPRQQAAVADLCLVQMPPTLPVFQAALSVQSNASRLDVPVSVFSGKVLPRFTLFDRDLLHSPPPFFYLVFLECVCVIVDSTRSLVLISFWSYSRIRLYHPRDISSSRLYWPFSAGTEFLHNKTLWIYHPVLRLYRPLREVREGTFARLEPHKFP